jgi:hypothetical protein
MKKEYKRKYRKMNDTHKEKLSKALKDYWAKIPYEPLETEQENNITNTKTEQ